jgi:hypothetical protein
MLNAQNNYQFMIQNNLFHEFYILIDSPKKLTVKGDPGRSNAIFWWQARTFAKFFKSVYFVLQLELKKNADNIFWLTYSLWSTFLFRLSVKEMKIKSI